MLRRIGLYRLKGKPVFVDNIVNPERFRWDRGDALPLGKHAVAFDFDADQ